MTIKYGYDFTCRDIWHDLIFTDESNFKNDRLPNNYSVQKFHETFCKALDALEKKMIHRFHCFNALFKSKHSFKIKKYAPLDEN